jgi:hypothetical protein
LFSPVSGYDTVEGNFSAEQISVDPYTTLKTSSAAKKSIVLASIGAVGGFLAWKLFNKKKSD